MRDLVECINCLNITPSPMHPAERIELCETVELFKQFTLPCFQDFVKVNFLAVLNTTKTAQTLIKSGFVNCVKLCMVCKDVSDALLCAIFNQFKRFVLSQFWQFGSSQGLFLAVAVTCVRTRPAIVPIQHRYHSNRILLSVC